MKRIIEEGKTILGIELGSTRIKTVLMGLDYNIIAYGNYDWENKYINNLWTYSLDDVWSGIQQSYSEMKINLEKKYDCKLTNIAAIGVSAMMHGYMPFDKEGEILVPFRTWRNTSTERASVELTKLFEYNIPHRWSIAHLYQAILDKEPHVEHIDYLTTLSGYVHWKLTDSKVLGIGDISGMFPVDIETKEFNEEMILKFENLIENENLPWNLKDIVPQSLVAGKQAGVLTAQGAKLLDITGELAVGIPLCPPEGDAGTGMVATNSIAKQTGNVSAGTSVFAMVVLEKELKRVHPEIDLVTTPNGNLVAMVHCNNCTSDLNAWASLFQEFAEALGKEVDKDTLFSTLFNKALSGDKDCGDLLSYGYLSGEHITSFEKGNPIFIRKPESNFNLANFMRVHLYSALATLKLGMDILIKEEEVKLLTLWGHGGFFKTEEVGQKIMAAAVNIPVSTMKTAAEGGPWGIALLALYMIEKESNETLEDYLEQRVFMHENAKCIEPDVEDVKGFEKFMERYVLGLPIERAAVDYMK